MVFMLMFNKMYTEAEEIRFSLFKFKVPAFHGLPGIFNTSFGESKKARSTVSGSTRLEEVRQSEDCTKNMRIGRPCVDDSFTLRT